MKKLPVSIIIVFIFLTFSLFSSEKILKREFLYKGRLNSLEIVSSNNGCDIIANTKDKNNISRLIPGENLFPKIFIDNSSYYVTFINYKKGDVKLCFYDSNYSKSDIISDRKFTYISSETVLVFIHKSPIFLLFRGIEEGYDNEDIFMTDLRTGTSIRITKTDSNEKSIELPVTNFKNIENFILKTKTLFFNYVYIIDPNSGSSKLLSKEDIPGRTNSKIRTISTKGLNTIVAFGDSITWGKMRMNNLTGEYHPELTYWFKTSEYLTENYGKTYTVNLGVNADTSQKGVNRMDDDFQYVDGYFCLTMFGTNDVGGNFFSSSSSVENIKWMLENARDKYHMYPIVSTIPPIKLYLPGVQFFKDETEELNSKIIIMANENGFPFVDSYTTFMNYSGGWESLLEDIKGTHPNPTGHQLIANLIIPKILSVPPAQTSVVNIESRKNSVNIESTENFEFDFDHYEVKFGYYPGKMDFDASFYSNKFSLIRFPVPVGLKIRETVFFKVRAVDMDGNSSDFSPIYAVKFNN